MGKLKSVGMAGLVWFCAACTSNGERTAVTEWQGSKPHFRLDGSYGGEEIDLAIEGGEASNLAILSCTRAYQAPLVDGKLDLTRTKFWEYQLQGIVMLKGERRKVELEFKRQDFTKLDSGKTMTVIPRDDEVAPGPGQFWFEWEWHDAATDDTLDERAALQGSFVMGEATGQPDANGIIPSGTGTFGGFLTAKWSESETISFSFTALCGENEIESEE